MPTPEIYFGDFKGDRRWERVRDIPDQRMRDAVLNMVVYQGDTEFASNEQQRFLVNNAPSEYDLASLVRIMVEETRHGYQMCHLMVEHFGSEGKIEAQKMLERRAFGKKNRLLNAFNDDVTHWLDFFAYTNFMDRDGKFQLTMLSHSSFAPLAASMGPMLREESFHMGTGITGLRRIAKAGVIPVDIQQKYYNKWISGSLDLFGTDHSGSAQWAYTWGIKGRVDEDKTAERRQGSTQRTRPPAVLRRGRADGRARERSEPERDEALRAGHALQPQDRRLRRRTLHRRRTQTHRGRMGGIRADRSPDARRRRPYSQRSSRIRTGSHRKEASALSSYRQRAVTDRSRRRSAARSASSTASASSTIGKTATSAFVEMDDPPANTYTHEMMRQLDEAILDARFDQDVEVIVLTGKGEKFFSAGANIGMLNAVTPEFKYMFCLHANETLARLEQTPKLVIAALNGHCVGGGLEIAMAADIRIARKDAGKIGPAGSLARRAAGHRRHAAPGAPGRQVPRDRADGHRPDRQLRAGDGVGHRQRLYEGTHDEFREQIADYAKQFCTPNKAPMAVGHIKRSVQTGAELPLQDALALERELQSLLFKSEDAKEGIAAYNEKRVAKFKNK